jgi:hypothetical protein
MRALLTTTLLLASVAAIAQPTAEKPLKEACPKLTAAQIAAIENYKGQFSENAWYARSYCVPVEEAERRMAIQLRDAVGPKTEPGELPAPAAVGPGALAALLQEKEAGTYGGLWIEHQPRYRVAVAFTSDAKATLAKYTTDPLFEAVERPGPSLAELRLTQDRLMKIFQERGFRWSMASTSEQTGKIEFELGQEAAPIRAAAARGEFELPAYVTLREPKPLPHPAPPPPRGGDTRVKAFPQVRYRTDMYPSTLVGVPNVPAQLELRAGCLVLTTAEGTRTALWDAEHALDLSDPAKIVVVDRLSGARFAVGDRVSLEGLQPGIHESRTQKAEKVGEAAACPGLYQVVDRMEPLAVQEAREKERRITTLMNQRRLSRTAAQARYAAEQVRVPQLQALRTRLLAEHPDRFGGIWVSAEEGKAHAFVLPGTNLDQLLPAALRPFVTSQEVPRSGRELDAAKAVLDAQIAAAGVKAQTLTEVIGGTLDIDASADPRAMSAALVTGKVTVPVFARFQWQNAMPLGGYRNGVGIEGVNLIHEKAPGFDRLREAIAAAPVLGYPDPNKGDERPMRMPSRAQSLDIAHWLTAFGQGDPDRFLALKRQGIDLVDAWQRQNGLSTPANRATIAEQVVIAEPVEVVMRDPGKDGFRSTVTWRVLETLKGTVRPGEAIRARMMGGEEADGTTAFGMDEPLMLPGFPTSLDKGSRWFLHLSPALYRHQAMIHGGAEAPRKAVVVAWTAPARVTGERVTLSDYQKSYTLTELRASIAPVQQAFARAGR